MAISTDQKYIALLNSDNTIWIGTSDLRKVYRIFKKPFKSPIDQISWYSLLIILTINNLCI